MAVVGLPLTGVGGTTADVAVDSIGGAAYQYMKKVDGLAASTVVERVLATTPASGDAGSVVRPIGSTAYPQSVVVGTGGSSANMVGTVVLSSGTTGITVGSAALLAGSSANIIGTVAITAGSSANTIGAVAQAGPATSGVYWFMQSIPFSSGNAARTTVATSVDVSLIAANANRKALVIASLSTVQVVNIGGSTAAVTTGLANASYFLQPMQQLTFGMGQLPLFLGPFRGINISSTAVGGGVAITEYT